MIGVEDLLVGDLISHGEAELTTGPFGTQLKAGEYVEDGIPLINVRNVGFGEVRGTDLEYLSEETALRLDRHRLAPGDIVFGRKGAVERHAYISKDQAGWVQGSDCLRLRLQSPRFLPRFVSYCLLTEHHKQWMKNHCSGGATMASLNQDILGRIALPLVAPTTQRKIVAILSAYDDLIENNTRRIKLLEEMTQRIYREWFFDFRYPGHEDVPLAESAIGRIPQGWKVKSASEAIAIDPKTAVPRDVDVPFIPMTSVSETTMHVSPIETRVNGAGAKFTNGDTLLARITPCLENGKTAYVQCLAEGESAVGSTEFIVLRSRLLSPETVYLLARSSDFRQHAIKSMSGATGRQRVRREAFDAYLLPVPDSDVLARFGQIVRPAFGFSYQLFVAISALREARDLLLPRLISGEIDVERLDIEAALVAA